MSDIDFFDLVGNEDQEDSRATKINGIILATVTSNEDKKNLGRVKVKYCELSDEIESDWVRVSNFMAGGNRGSFFVPEVNDHVLVAFLKGDINKPIVIGCLYSNEDKPAQNTDDGENNIKEIKTRSGHKLKFNDKEGEESLSLKSKSGHEIILDDSTGSEKLKIVDKTGQNKIEIDSVSNSIIINSNMNLKLKAKNIEINADATMTIKAKTLLKIKGLPVRIN